MKIVKPVIIEDYNDDWPFIFNELKEIHYITLLKDLQVITGPLSPRY